eukprot:jgi/Ulvmu1/1912/UM012_0072.1
MALLPARSRQTGRCAPSRWVLLLTSVTGCILLLAWLRSDRPSALRIRTGGVLTQDGVQASISGSDADNRHDDLRQVARSSFEGGGTGSVEVIRADAGLQANDWAAVSSLELPPRPDAHCESDVDPNTDHDEQLKQLFECRQRVAQDAARKACEQPAETAVSKPFRRAALDVGHFLLTNTAVDRTVLPDAPRIPIAVEPNSDFVSQELSGQGLWEASEVSAILTALETVRNSSAAAGAPGAAPPVLVDIGANLGVYTIVAAALGYPVIAFEAMSRNVAAIHQTLCWNPELAERVTLFPYGLGDAERSCAVLSGSLNVADGHLVCSEEEWAPYKGEFQARDTVHAVRLGHYLAGVQADVVKMDVEGYEFAVVQGAGGALDGVSTALTELSQDMAKKSGREFRDVAGEYLRAWQDRGFEIRFCGAEPCAAGEPLGIEAALDLAVENGQSNVLFSRSATVAA